MFASHLATTSDPKDRTSASGTLAQTGSWDFILLKRLNREANALLVIIKEIPEFIN